MVVCVVDASFMLAWGLDEKLSTPDRELFERIFQFGAVVPSIWALEIINILVGVERSGRSKRKLEYVAGNILEFPIEVDRRTHEFAWHRVVALARKHSLSSYDASYLELAIRREAVLLTLDHELARAGKAEGIVVLPERG